MCAGHVFVSKLMRLVVCCLLWHLYTQHVSCLYCLAVCVCVCVHAARGDSFLLDASLHNAPVGKPNSLELLVLENFAGIG